MALERGDGAFGGKGPARAPSCPWGLKFRSQDVVEGQGEHGPRSSIERRGTMPYGSGTATKFGYGDVGPGGHAFNTGKTTSRIATRRLRHGVIGRY